MVRKYSTVFFILTVIVVSVYYSYPGMLFKRPQSIHAWRQADDASFALNYYQDGMHFFQPEVNNLTTSQGTSGKTAPGENTYLYYFVASLYHIFGYHEFIFRLVFTLIFLAGLFFLYKTTRYLFDDVFWAFALPLLLFSSPVIMYYGNNFLPNTPALAFVLTGWFFFFRYRKEKRTLFLYLTMLFFLLAAWLKLDKSWLRSFPSSFSAIPSASRTSRAAIPRASEILRTLLRLAISVGEIRQTQQTAEMIDWIDGCFLMTSSARVKASSMKLSSPSALPSNEPRWKSPR